MSYLELTTVSASGTENVDIVPSAVSTGYQAQNTLAIACNLGLDSVSVSWEMLEIPRVTVHAGGVIEENGLFYTLKQDVRFSFVVYNRPFVFVLTNGATVSERNIALIPLDYSSVSWSTAKNGWYTDDNHRVLSKVVQAFGGGNQQQYEGVSVSPFIPTGTAELIRGAVNGDSRQALAFQDSKMVLASKGFTAIPHDHSSTPVDVAPIDSDDMYIVYFVDHLSQRKLRRVNFSDGAASYWTLSWVTGIVGIALLPSGNIALSSSGDNKVRVYSSFGGGSLLYTFDAPATRTSAICFYDSDLWLINNGNASSGDSTATLYRFDGVSTTVKKSYDLLSENYCDISIHNGFVYAMRNRVVNSSNIMAPKERIDVFAIVPDGFCFVKTVRVFNSNLIGITNVYGSSENENDVNLVSITSAGFNLI